MLAVSIGGCHSNKAYHYTAMAENLESGWILLVISAFNLVATNGVLTTSHWMAAFEAQSKATGIFILDLLIYFFQDILSTEAGRTIFETIFSFAMVSVTLVLYEGSRYESCAQIDV